jgi:hypothetical protein
MSERKAEMVSHAIKQGMDPGEAEHLVDANDSIVVGIQLPPNVAAEYVPKLAKIGMLTGPVRFYICIANDRKERVADLLSDGGKEELTQEWDYSCADEGLPAAVERIKGGFPGLSSDDKPPEGSKPN